MTIESNGQAYTFEGYLTSTEINMEPDEIDPVDGWRAFSPVLRRTNVTLEIVATGPITRELLPKKGRRNVQ